MARAGESVCVCEVQGERNVNNREMQGEGRHGKYYLIYSICLLIDFPLKRLQTDSKTDRPTVGLAGERGKRGYSQRRPGIHPSGN